MCVIPGSVPLLGSLPSPPSPANQPMSTLSLASCLGTCCCRPCGTARSLPLAPPGSCASCMGTAQRPRPSSSSTCLGKGQGKERTLVGWLGGGEGRDPKSGTDPGITHTGKYGRAVCYRDGGPTKAEWISSFLCTHPTPHLLGKCGTEVARCARPWPPPPAASSCSHATRSSSDEVACNAGNGALLPPLPGAVLMAFPWDLDSADGMS